MYRKYSGILIAMNCLLCLCYVTSQQETVDVYGKELQNVFTQFLEESNSNQRSVSKETVEYIQEKQYTEEEYQMLYRIVEAEAGGEDIIGKILVVNVIFNRMNSEKFPNNIQEIVFQKVKGVYQFSPIANGRYDEVVITDDTRNAVERAIAGEDYSMGALYFMARPYADPENTAWFDETRNYLFQHGGHEFFL